MPFNSPNESDPAASSAAHSSPGDQQSSANPFEIARPYTNGHGQMPDIGKCIDFTWHEKWLESAFGITELPTRATAQIFTPRESDRRDNNELHEWLGDAVWATAVKISVMTARNLERPRHSAASCTNLTSNEFLAGRARQLGFNFDMVVLHANKVRGPNATTKMTADVVEATIGTVHSLQGFEAAMCAVHHFIGKDNFITETDVVPNMSIHPNGKGAFTPMPLSRRFEKSYNQIERLEQRIGHPFDNLQLLYHAVFPTEDNRDRVTLIHQRLRAIGRSALYLAATDCVHSVGSARHESVLSLQRSEMLRGREVAGFADEIGVLGARRRPRGSLRLYRPSSYGANEALLEAVIGAIYVDAGYRAVARLMAYPLVSWVRNDDETRQPHTNGKAKRNDPAF